MNIICIGVLTELEEQMRSFRDGMEQEEKMKL